MASVTLTPLAGRTPTVTATRTPTTTPRATVTATRTPVATRTPLPTATPRRGPSQHPGFGDVPWKPGEFYAWTLNGHNIGGTAWQLMTRSGDEWQDTSGLRQIDNGVFSSYSSRTAFDATTYRLRGYDSRQDKPATVLHATLAGSQLDYTSYQSWGHKGCSAFKRTVPANAVVPGMMADLIRTTRILGRQRASYPVFDPYGPLYIGKGSYSVVGHETLSTVLGKIPTVRVRFVEPSQPPLDVWYSTSPQHIVLKWATPGVFQAVLTHYEGHSTRVTLPAPPVQVKLSGKNAACASPDWAPYLTPSP